MEVPRMLLAISGKFPGDYDDGRYTTDAPHGNCKSYSDIKDTLQSNLGRMLVLTVGEDAVGQSAAINFYIASECGLMGKSTLEAAQIISIQEHLKEMNTAFRKVIPYGNEPTEDDLDKWFNTGAEDSTGPANMRNRDRFMKWYSARIEATVGSGGFAVGGA